MWNQYTNTWTHVCLVSLSQVVREVLLDVLDEVVRVLRIEVQHLIESFQVDTLQVTVGQGFHICIGFYHPVIQGQVCSDQVTFTCSGRERVRWSEKEVTA